MVRGCRRPQVVDERCKSHANQEADKQWSLEVRKVGRCEAANWLVQQLSLPSGRITTLSVRCGGVLQAAHGFPRTYPKTRLVLLNGFCICAGHHRWFTSHPLEWTAFMQERLGATVYEELRQMALGLLPVPPAAP